MNVMRGNCVKSNIISVISLTGTADSLSSLPVGVKGKILKLYPRRIYKLSSKHKATLNWLLVLHPVFFKNFLFWKNEYMLLVGEIR